MVGRTVGHYRITAELGAGGMGEVYLAEDARLGRRAAVKFLPVDVAAAAGPRRRFLAEARAASALSHPHVCVVYDVGETDDGRLFIAMEFVDGRPLDAVVRDGPLEVPRAVEIAAQVADALDAAHARGVVHRDVKPANIRLTDRGQVKVLDFGIAKRVPRPKTAGGGDGDGGNDTTADLGHTPTGEPVGTPAYMSPEQALGRAVDHRTDIFSAGVVLYELVTGRRPFTGSGFAEIVDRIVHAQPPALGRLNYDVPAEFERITLKCLQKQPDRRYQSARELLVDLRNLAMALEHAAVPGGPAVPDDTGMLQPHAGSAGVPAAEPISLERLRDGDVLLSYAAIDDQPMVDGRPGWVSQLHRNLEVRIQQLSGEKVAVARLPDYAASELIGGELPDHLTRAKAMISVVSPPFVRSELCRREVEWFWRGAERTGGGWVNDRARLLKVIKTAVAPDEVPRALADIFTPLSGFEFFELDPESGRVREFDEAFGPLLKQRFFERVYDLAYDTCQVLRTMRPADAGAGGPPEPTPGRPWVYLATTTSDVQGERDRVRRELVERGHRVLPDGPLPMLARDVESAVRQCLEKCAVAVHLLGRHYGVTPEDSSESVPALQVRLTAEQSEHGPLQRLIWLAGGGGPVADERQQAFVRRVQEDPALHRRAEVIEGNLNVLKKDLIRRLSPPPEARPTAPLPAGAAGGAPKLYLICDPKDESAVEALEDYLFAQGVEVILPAFDGDDADAASLHRDNLLSCDAVLVYYGAAPKAWVDVKLRELLKVAGYGRERPIAVQAVYVAPPFDHRKDRYRSLQAGVIRQPDDFAPTADLGSLVGRVKEACA